MGMRRRSYLDRVYEATRDEVHVPRPADAPRKGPDPKVQREIGDAYDARPHTADDLPCD